jgi:formate hydrogenlyase subunit 6/NADH:ubiquinone oxidoreductase subunit I
MNWLKNKIRDWLEVEKAYECAHTWVVHERMKWNETVTTHKIGPYESLLSPPDRYKKPHVMYTLRCIHCGALKIVEEKQ